MRSGNTQLTLPFNNKQTSGQKHQKIPKPRCWGRYLASQEEALVEPSYFCRASGSFSILLPNPLGWRWTATVGRRGTGRGRHWNPTPGPDLTGDQKKPSWKKKTLRQGRLQPRASSCLQAFQGCRAIPVHSWGLQRRAAGRSLVPKYSLWLGCFLAYRIQSEPLAGSGLALPLELAWTTLVEKNRCNL